MSASTGFWTAIATIVTSIAVLLGTLGKAAIHARRERDRLAAQERMDQRQAEQAERTRHLEATERLADAVHAYAAGTDARLARIEAEIAHVAEACAAHGA